MKMPVSSSWRQTIARAVMAAAIAGVLDILAAIATSWLKGVAPLRLLQAVASGLLGSDAYAGGPATGGLGLGLHFLIMLIFALFFFLAVAKWRLLQRRSTGAALLYSVAIYLLMQYVVLPLSAFPHPVAATVTAITIGLVTHLLCVGVPFAVVARWRKRHDLDAVAAQVHALKAGYDSHAAT